MAVISTRFPPFLGRPRPASALDRSSYRMRIADTTKNLAYRQLGRTSAFMRNLLAAGCHQ